MNLSQFLQATFTDGRVRMPLTDADEQPANFTRTDLANADQLLADFEAVERLNFAFAAPAYSPHAAQWAARMLYRACQFAVDRTPSAETVEQVLSEPCPSGTCPEAMYAVDFTLRHLAAVRQHVKHASEDDPVEKAVARWAAAWPLSSVGMRNVTPLHVEVLLSHPGLRRTYADRILLAGDATRAEHPATRDAIVEAIGAYPELAVSLASPARPP